MSKTTFRQVLENHVDSLLVDDDDAAPFLTKLKVEMNRGLYEKTYLDTVFQKWERFGKYDLYDAWCFAQFHYKLTTGAIARTRVSIGIAPFADNKVDENDLALSNLPFPFSGSFWGGTQDQDGLIKWNTPILAETSECKGGNDVNIDDDIIQYWVIPPGILPLEVGYMDCSKSYFYQVSGKQGVARWPYGSRDIHLLLNLDSWQAEKVGDSFKRGDKSEQEIVKKIASQVTNGTWVNDEIIQLPSATISDHTDP